MIQDHSDDNARRASAAQARAAQACSRLLALAETRHSGQARHVARFLAGTYNGEAYPFKAAPLPCRSGRKPKDWRTGRRPSCWISTPSASEHLIRCTVGAWSATRA